MTTPNWACVISIGNSYYVVTLKFLFFRHQINAGRTILPNYSPVPLSTPHVCIYMYPYTDPLSFPCNSHGSILCAPTVDGDSTRLDQMSQTLVISLQQLWTHVTLNHIKGTTGYFGDGLETRGCPVNLLKKHLRNSLLKKLLTQKIKLLYPKKRYHQHLG